MATRAEIEETYNYMDEIFRESFGDARGSQLCVL